MLFEGVAPWILCYDESACEAFYEWRMESYAEAKENGEEGLEKPQSIADAKGPWLAKRFKPLPPDRIGAAIESLRKWVAGAPNPRCRLPSPEPLDGA